MKTTKKETIWNDYEMPKKVYIYSKKGGLKFELEKMYKCYALFNYTDNEFEEWIYSEDLKDFINHWKRYYPFINKVY